MNIRHIFSENNFGENFETHNAILDTTPYKPEVLILGTFNPEIDNNLADFFYGRNYFWVAFKNLFIHGQIDLTELRTTYNPYNPSLEEIFKICKRLKLTFSDLILSVFDDIDNNQLVLRRNKVYIDFNNIIYNPIKDLDLQRLNNLHKVNWNTENIIKYLEKNKQLRKIYFTRKYDACWSTQLDLIKDRFQDIEIIPIYTPTAVGGALHQQVNIYNNGKMIPLLRHWVHNNDGNFGNLNHNNWLTNNGVNINNF